MYYMKVRYFQHWSYVSCGTRQRVQQFEILVSVAQAVNIIQYCH